MEGIHSASGKRLKAMLAAAADWLEQNASFVDALNIFPVPDGDTGSNMLLSMRSAQREAESASDQSASSVAEAFARGALLGARGNSGVILSQFWQGLAQGLKGKKSFTSTDLARALQKSCTLAYRAMSKPVEGTILTVIKDIAGAARKFRHIKEDLLAFMEKLVRAAKESVAGTPKLLKMLEEAGVVDAGGQGLHIILQGILNYLRGERGQSAEDVPLMSLPARMGRVSVVSEVASYGFCTEFLLQGKGLDEYKIRAAFEARERSLIVARSGGVIRVHIHTADPGPVVRFAETLGAVDRVSIRDMDRQHEEFVQAHEQRPLELAVAVIAVTAGEGLAAIFKSLGAAEVVTGEKAGELSPGDLLEAIDAAVAENIIILPNSTSVFPVLEQIRRLAKKQIAVVPARTVPQGVSAMVAFSPEEDFATNVRLMEAAMREVRSIEICRATGQYGKQDADSRDGRRIGLLDGSLKAAGHDARQTLERLLEALSVKEVNMITVYYGAGASAEEAAGIAAYFQRRYSPHELDTAYSGHPSCEYIISIE